MMMRFLSDVVIFDLDDTLYKEVSFVESGFKAVARYLGNISFADELMALWSDGKSALGQLIEMHSIPVSTAELLEVYRNHYPAIRLDASTVTVLRTLTANGRILGIITDGRLRTQRNKIEALGLHSWFSPDNIIISEEFGSTKPDARNYQFFMSKYPSRTYSYIGDNVSKDFVSPKSLGWQTICLKDNGQNIHSQNFKLNESYLPDIIINNISEIIY